MCASIDAEVGGPGDQQSSSIVEIQMVLDLGFVMNSPPPRNRKIVSRSRSIFEGELGWVGGGRKEAGEGGGVGSESFLSWW